MMRINLGVTMSGRGLKLKNAIARWGKDAAGNSVARNA